MDLLLVALAAFTVVEVIDHIGFWFSAKIQIGTEIGSAIGAWLALHPGSDIDALVSSIWILAGAGLAHIVRAAFRLIRAWADRTEVANTLPLHRGRM
jgi:hypothetical protein